MNSPLDFSESYGDEPEPKHMCMFSEEVKQAHTQASSGTTIRKPTLYCSCLQDFCCARMDTEESLSAAAICCLLRGKGHLSPQWDYSYFGQLSSQCRKEVSMSGQHSSWKQFMFALIWRSGLPSSDLPSICPLLILKCLLPALPQARGPHMGLFDWALSALA